jgi:predicted ester cyclase
MVTVDRKDSPLMRPLHSPLSLVVLMLILLFVAGCQPIQIPAPAEAVTPEAAAPETVLPDPIVAANITHVKDYWAAVGAHDLDLMRMTLADPLDVFHFGTDRDLFSSAPDLISAWDQVLAEMPDYKVVPLSLFGEGDLVAMRGETTLTSSGKPLQFGVMSLARLQDGKIVEGWTIEDTYAQGMEIGYRKNSTGQTTFPWTESQAVAGDVGTPAANKELVQKLWAAEPSQQEALLGADFGLHIPWEPLLTTADDRLQYMEYLHTAFPDLQITLHEPLVAQDDLVAVRFDLSGTHQADFMGIKKPQNKLITGEGMAIYRVANGKIVDEWMIYSANDMVAQLRSK